VFAVTITGVLANTLVAPALPELAADLSIPDWQAALVITAATVPGIGLAPLVGLVADRRGRRPVLVACLVAFGVFGLAGAAAPSLPWLLAARAGQGAGSAGLINLAVVLLADTFDGEERARRIGQNAAVLTATIAVAPPLGGALAAAGGWRLTFVPFALGLVVAVAVVVTLPPEPRRPPTKTSLLADLRAAGPALAAQPVRSTLTTGVVVFILLFGVALTTMPFLLTSQFGLTSGAIGAVMAAPSVTSTLMSLNVSRIRAWLGPGRMVTTGLVAMAMSFAGVAVSPWLGLVVAFVLIQGLGEGLLIPALQDQVAGGAPEHQRAVVIAVWVGFVRLGQAIGPAAAGIGLALWGGSAVFAAGAGLAALWAIWWARRGW